MRITGSFLSVLLLCLVDGSVAFVSQTAKGNSLSSSKPKTTSSSSPAPITQLDSRRYAWHEYVRNDPYAKNRNGEVNVLRNEYYYPQNRLGNTMQPYGGGYRDNIRLTRYPPYRSSWGSGYDDYNGPYAPRSSSRRYGSRYYDYGYGGDYGSSRGYGYQGPYSRSYFSDRIPGAYPPRSDYGYERNRDRDYGYGSSSRDYGYGDYSSRSRYGSDYGYSGRYGSDYGYGRESGYGSEYGRRGYHHPMSPVALITERSAKVPVQGQSLKTWSFSSAAVERIHVALRTDGRPLDADISLWQGPDNEPVKIRVYAEDGLERPFSAAIETPRGPSTVTVRNKGQLEFPLNAHVLAETERAEPILPSAMQNDLRYPSVNIQGGSLRTFPFDASVESVAIRLETDGRPLDARIELLQGPSNNKQVVEVYSEDGMERPFFMVVETPREGHVVRITNTATLEFPLVAWVEPHLFGESMSSRVDGFVGGERTRGFGGSRW